MALAKIQKTIFKVDSNTLPAAGHTYSIQNSGGGSAIPIYANSSGTIPIDNPGTLPANGLLSFFIRPGTCRIKVTDPVTLDDQIWDNEPCISPDVLSSASATLQFATLADLVNGNPINKGETVDFADYVGQKVTTVANNSTSGKGGADYTIWTLAAYRTFIGDGAWVPDGYGDHYVGGGTTHVAVLGDFFRVPCTVFGVDSTGATDSTIPMTAFIQYLSYYRKSGVIPAGDYQWADVPVSGNLDITGAGGETNKTRIKVNVNNAACFNVPAGSGSGVVAAGEIQISGLSVGAAAGVTGAKFWNQEERDLYTAYAEFNDIETWGDLAAGYDGYFIFTDWKKCRHGFRGTPAATNQFIKSTQDNTSQSIETNLCKVESCRVFNTAGAAAIELERGFNWHITDTDFEGLNNLAISARGIIGLRIDDNWFEEIDHDYMIYADQIGGPSPQGSWQVNITNNHVNMDATAVDMIQTAGAALFTVDENTFIRLGTTKKLITDTWAERVSSFRDNRLESSAGFIFGDNVSTQVTKSKIKDSTINSPKTEHIHISPLASYGITISDFTTAGLVAFTDVASGIGLSNAVQMQLGNSNNLVYFQIPTKIVEFLRGKTITVAAIGYAAVGGQPDQPVRAAIWNALPSGDGTGTAIVTNINSNNVNLSISSRYYTVSNSETSLYYGVYAGGSALNALVAIEAVSVTLGRSEPDFISIS